MRKLVLVTALLCASIAIAQALLWYIGAINFAKTKTDGRYVRAIRSF